MTSTPLTIGAKMFKFTAFLVDCAVNHRAQMIEEIRADFSKKTK